MDTPKYTIEPLSYNTLHQTILLRDTVFSNLSEDEKVLLEASLDPKKFHTSLENNSIESIQYWIIFDSFAQKTIGIVGLYYEVDFPYIAWLGWFAVDKKYRKNKLGKKLLEFAIEKAKENSAKELHLYSWDSKEYAPAIELYKKYQFTFYTPNHKTYKRDIFMKKVL